MTSYDDGTAFQSCIDTSCGRNWDDHTADEKERCLAYAMHEADIDPATEAEVRADLANGDPTAVDRLDRPDCEVDTRELEAER